MKAIKPVVGVCAVATIVKTEPAIKCPTSGINAATNTTIAIEVAYGILRISPTINITTAAKAEIDTWLPTKVPIREIIASEIFAIRSRREAGAKR